MDSKVRLNGESYSDDDDCVLTSDVNNVEDDDREEDEKMQMVIVDDEYDDDDDDTCSAVGFCQVFIEEEEEEQEVQGTGGCSKSKDRSAVECNQASGQDNATKGREKSSLENGDTTVPIYKKLQILRCMHCAYKASKINKMKLHIRKHCCKIHDCRCFNASGASKQHPETPFICDFCNYRFTTAARLAKHRKRVHFNDSPFSCQLCDFSSSSSVQLKRHAQTHAGEKRFRCEFCDFACDYSGDLKHHLTTHTGVEPFTCDHCDFETWEADELDKHRPTHYKKLFNKNRPYHCPFCNYQGSNAVGLRSHLETHADKYPYSCDWLGCCYRSDRPANLEAHLRSHRFECSLCSYKFTTRKDLRMHAITHVAIPKGHLRIQPETHTATPKRHKRRIQPKTQHICCEYCGYKCSDSDDLKNHLQINSCNKLFICDFCDYKGELFVDLEKHLDEHSDILYSLFSSESLSV